MGFLQLLFDINSFAIVFFSFKSLETTDCYDFDTKNISFEFDKAL